MKVVSACELWRFISGKIEFLGISFDNFKVLDMSIFCESDAWYHRMQTYYMEMFSWEKVVFVFSLFGVRVCNFLTPVVFVGSEKIWEKREEVLMCLWERKMLKRYMDDE